MPDARSVPLRGAMECFYGRPWSMADRRAVITESARWGMNCFVYGPSGDARTGASWREPYPAAELAEFGQLSAVAADVGVSLCWRISASAPLDPQQGVVFSDAGQRRLLLNRVSDVVAAGFRHVLLTFDDVDHGLVHAADRSAFAGAEHPVAAAHAGLAVELAEHLASTPAELAICPTRYWGSSSHGYLQALDAALPEHLPLCWTGPQVTSRVIDAVAPDDPRRNRPIWLWDNYPVNDWDGLDPVTAEPAQRRLFLDPLIGRAPELSTQLDGYFVNCGASAQASLPAVVTAARWAQDAAGYDPEAAIAEAIAGYDDDRGCLALLRSMACSTPLASRAPHPLVVRSWSLLAAAPAGRREDGPALAADLREAAERAEAAVRSTAPVLGSARWYARALAEQLSAAAYSVLALSAEAAQDDAALAECAQWLADRRSQLDGLMRTAVLDGGLLALIETGRGLAGPPIPPHDV